MNPEDHIQPLYIKKLGPASSSTSYTGKIHSQIVNQMTPVTTALLSVKDLTVKVEKSVDSLKKDLHKSVDPLHTYAQGMIKFRDKMDKWVVDNQYTVKTAWIAFTAGMIGFGLVLGSVALLLLHEYWVNRPYRVVLTTCSLLLGVLCILGLAFVIIFAAVSLVMSDTCETSKDLRSPEKIDDMSVLFSKTVSTYINICLNSNQTDLAYSTEFGHLATPLSTFSTILTAYESYEAVITHDTSYNQFKSIGANLAEVKPKQIDRALTTYLNVFSNSTSDKSVQALHALNQWSDSSLSDTKQVGCSVSTRDQWVTLQSDCQHTFVEASTPQLNRGNPSCLLVQSWDGALIDQRYTGYLQCGTLPVLNTIGELHSSFVAYMKDLKSKFTKTRKDLLQMESRIVGLANQTLAQQQTFDTYYHSYVYPMVKTAVVAPQGILNNLDCGFVRDHYDAWHTAVCKNCLPGVFVGFVCLCSVSIVGYLLMFSALFLSRRLKTKQD